MTELKPCPFCQSRAEHYSFNFRKHTVRCHYCLADCGEHDTPERAAFVWNTRPAEDALKAENERMKAVIAEIGAMTLTGDEEVEDFIFLLCKNIVGDEEIKKAYKEHLKKNIAKMLTNVPATAEKGGEDE